MDSSSTSVHLITISVSRYLNSILVAKVNTLKIQGEVFWDVLLPLLTLDYPGAPSQNIREFNPINQFADSPTG